MQVLSLLSLANRIDDYNTFKFYALKRKFLSLPWLILSLSLNADNIIYLKKKNYWKFESKYYNELQNKEFIYKTKK